MIHHIEPDGTMGLAAHQLCRHRQPLEIGIVAQCPRDSLVQDGIDIGVCIIRRYWGQVDG